MWRPSDQAIASLDERVAELVGRMRVPSVVYGVIDHGQLVHVAAIGEVAVGSGIAPTSATLYRIASMTKSFTAAAVLMLRDEGAIDLDSPVSRYVPELEDLKGPTTDSPPVSIRHLLSMASGLATDDPWGDRLLDIEVDALSNLFRSGGTFAFPPGTAFEYSNYGYAMLGRVVSNASGLECHEFISRRLLAPLGLQHTVWELPDAPAGTMSAPGYQLVDGAFEAEEEPLATGGFSAMGGLWSTLDDLASWVGFFTEAFPPRDEVDDLPLRRSSRREMQQISRSIQLGMSRDDVYGPLRLSPAGYGMGLMLVDHLDTGTMVGHSGGLPGYGSNMRWLPDRGIGVVALSNATYAPMPTVTLHMLEHLNNVGALAPRRRPNAPKLQQAAESLVALLNDWDAGEAAEMFAINVALDESLERRAAAAGRLRDRHGKLSLEEVLADSSTSGRVIVRGERGTLRIDLELSAEVPARVQWYEITSVLPVPEDLLETAFWLVSFTAGREISLEELADRCDGSQVAAALVSDLTATRMLYGACDLGDVKAYDGGNSATFRWIAQRGRLDVSIVVGDDGISSVRFTPRPVPDPHG